MKPKMVVVVNRQARVDQGETRGGFWDKGENEVQAFVSSFSRLESKSLCRLALDVVVVFGLSLPLIRRERAIFVGMLAVHSSLDKA